MYDKKDTITKEGKITEIVFPLEVTNFRREKMICTDNETLYSHIFCDTRLEPIQLVLSSNIHPEAIITSETLRMLALFQSIKRFGMQFYYKDTNTIPNPILQAITLIYDTIDNAEMAQIKSQRDEIKSQKINTKKR